MPPSGRGRTHRSGVSPPNEKNRDISYPLFGESIDVKPLTSSIEIHPMFCSGICKCRFSTVSVWCANYEATGVSAGWPIWGTVKSALAHLRHLPHAHRFAFRCDCSELRGE